MKIAIIGNGNIGSGLAKVIQSANYDVAAYGKDDDIAVAVSDADLIVLSTPFAAVADVAESADFNGKIVIDVSNPVSEDFSGLEVGHVSSAAEVISELLPGAKVVKAFNTIFAQHYENGLNSSDDPLQTFIASDHEDAKQLVRDLAVSVGFNAINAGPLINARYLEPIGYMNIQFGYVLGLGVGIAPSWQTRES